MKKRINTAESGFSLIEVIITIVMVAIVGSMLFTYFGTSLTRSSDPIFRLNAATRLNAVLENISASYGKHINSDGTVVFPKQWQPNTTYATGDIIIPPVNTRTGIIYRADSGGMSGSSIPEWLKETIQDNTVTWTPHAAAPRLVNQSWLQNKEYEAYDVIVQGAYQYVTQLAGTSGSVEPTPWPTTVEGKVTDESIESITWIYSGQAPTTGGPNPTQVLHNDIGTEDNDYDNAFGRYRVIHNRFITFDTAVNPKTEINLTGNLSHTDYGKYLKVTIGMHSGDADRTNETLTTLFVIR